MKRYKCFVTHIWLLLDNIPPVHMQEDDMYEPILQQHTEQSTCMPLATSDVNVSPPIPKPRVFPRQRPTPKPRTFSYSSTVLNPQPNCHYSPIPKPRTKRPSLNTLCNSPTSSIATGEYSYT